jgi:type I restriction enzyme, S subunit
VTPAKVERIPRVKNGDLVVVDASEDYEGLGSSVEIVNLDGDEVVAGLHTMLLRDNENHFADGYRGCIQYIPSVRAALQRVATGISVYGISKSNLARISIPCPPISRQKEIVDFMAAIDSGVDAAILSRLLEIRVALLKLLMSGKMRVE